MGDVLPPKRQTVVNRLKRRFDSYRNHHNACLPRYEQASNGLYEAQRQETLLLKQRFLESKSKKTKNHKSDHHRSTCKDPAAEGIKPQIHPKPVKRAAEEPPILTTPDGVTEELEKASKSARIEKSTPSIKTDKTTEQQLQKPQQQQALHNFVQLANQFNKSPSVHLIQPLTVPTASVEQPASNPNRAKSEFLLNSNQNDSQSFPGTIPINDSHHNDIECKQEKDTATPDLCQCRSQSSSNGGTGGDRLSDTFPSLGFAEDSGDDVIHPDILKDLIEDVFTNSADIMKDFNFEDSVGSIKDQEDAAKDIIELVKGPSPGELGSFQTEGLTFTNAQVNHQSPNDIFDSIPASSGSSLSIVTTTSTPTTTESSFYTQSQRVASYGGGANSNIPIQNGLGMNFKLTEPSPAALTLKQMAEQHQNNQQKQQQQQQQQQIVNTPLTNRPAFNQDTFVNHLNQLRPNYLNGNNSTNSSITQVNSDQNPNPNPASIFNGYNVIDYPGVKPINQNQNSNPNGGDIFKQEESMTSSEMSLIQDDSHQKQRQPKTPAYGITRPLTHYSDAMVTHQQLQPQGSLQQQHPLHSPMGQTQFLSNTDPRFQMTQSQQIHNVQQMQPQNHDIKQQPSMIQLNHNMYSGYSAAQQNTNTNMMQHVSMAQQIHYPSQHFFSNSALNNNRPPPEYKAHQPNMMNNDAIHMQFKNSTNYVRNTHRPSNVTITPDGITPPRTMEWRQNVMGNQSSSTRIPFPHQDNSYVGNLVRSTQQQQFYPHQYRMAGSHPMSGSNVNPHNNHLLMQQRNRMVAQLRPRSDLRLSADPAAMNPMYNTQHSDIIKRQDGSQINLDFLDIESSASDLLNFDQVMQGNVTHFSLLDDIEILGK